MTPFRIILADDHVLLRQGIKNIIQNSEDMEVVGEAGDGLDLLNILKTVAGDMVILDISMPNLRGFEAAREIKTSYPNIKILILSMHKQKEYVYHAFSAGASGYLLKEDTDTEQALLHTGRFHARQEGRDVKVSGRKHTASEISSLQIKIRKRRSIHCGQGELFQVRA